MIEEVVMESYVHSIHVFEASVARKLPEAATLLLALPMT